MMQYYRISSPLVKLPGMDLPNSKYSSTEGLRNPAGTKLVLRSLFLSSKSPSTSFSGSGGGGALGRFTLDFCSKPSERKINFNGKAAKKRAGINETRFRFIITITLTKRYELDCPAMNQLNGSSEVFFLFKTNINFV